MKRAIGVKKISVKMSGRESGSYRVLAETISGSKKVIADPGLTAYQLPDGTILEFYSEGAVYPGYLFASADVVISYKVDDLGKAVADLTKAGAELLGPVDDAGVNYRFSYLKMDSQHVIGLYEY